MSLSVTSLASGTYLRRIKAAVLRAVVKSHKPDAIRDLGIVEVYNRRGRPSLMVIARKGAGFEVITEDDRDVTDMVKAQLVKYHADPLAYDQLPMWPTAKGAQ